MNKKPFIFLLSIFTLAGCAKTKLLYGENAYNSPVFDKNYYTEWEGVKELDKKIQSEQKLTPLNYSCSDYVPNPGEKAKEVTVNGKVQKGYYWAGDKEKQFGYNHNLSKIEKGFNYGVTSKLFDGRVRCESLYQKSRVQVNSTGFAMYFPKMLVSAQYLGLGCRGGSDYPQGQEFAHNDLQVKLTWTFYIHLDNGKYNVVIYDIDAKIPVDNGGNTAFINFGKYELDNMMPELSGAVAMSLTWKCTDPRMASEKPDLTDNYKSKTKKHHLALMLYEVFIGDSVWR